MAYNGIGAGVSLGGELNQSSVPDDEFDIFGLIEALKSGPSPWLTAGLKGATGLLGGIAGLLRGPSWQEKTRKRVARRIESRMYTPLIRRERIKALLPNIRGGLTPALNQIGRRVGATVGMRSGVGQGEIARSEYGNLQAILAAIEKEAMFANANAPFQRAQLIAALTRE